MQCAVNDCPYRVIKDDTGQWHHVDTHGVSVEHRAVPKHEQQKGREVCPRCSSVVVDLGQHMKELHSAAGA